MQFKKIFTKIKSKNLKLNQSQKTKIFITLLLGAFLMGHFVLAEENSGHNTHNYALTFFWIALLLMFAKISSLIEKFGQPSVLGELLIGVFLGNAFLLGLDIFEPIKHDTILPFLSELGVVILLFQIGLESNINEMKKVGKSALLVAVVGVIIPFVLGSFILGPLLIPGLSANAYLFLGAALTATSVGITARVFKDLKCLHLKEAQIILGAAVIDDVLGLILLAVISAIVTTGAASIGLISWIVAKAIIFLVSSIVLGQLLASKISKLFSKINTGVSMKFSIVISFALTFAFLAKLFGLAPIIGAFAAGLILDPVHFRYFKDLKIVNDIKETIKNFNSKEKETIESAMEPHAHREIEYLIEPVGNLLVPIFFVMTGIGVKLEVLGNLSLLFTAFLFTLLAVFGKYVSGFVAGKVNRAIVGFGMVPRGEVGLIFASIGKALGVISDEIFSVIVIMVILTTLLTPPILGFLLKKQAQK